MPQFDLTTTEGLNQAIQFVNDQTQENSISNVLIADILKALKNRDIDISNLQTIDKRRLKNAIGVINTGGFTIGNLDVNYGAETFSFMVKSSNLPDEEFIINRGSYANYIRYALGEQVYEVVTKDATIDSGLSNGEYYTIGLFPNGNFLFGRNLGNLPAGTSLGVIQANETNPAPMSIYKQNFGNDIFKSNANVLITNNSTQTLPIEIKAETQYFAKSAIPFGQTVQKPFYNLWSDFVFYLTATENVTLTSGLKIEIFMNRSSQQQINFQVGTQFWKNVENWLQYTWGVNDTDNIEIVLSDF